MELELTKADRRLLDALQSEFPLVPEPWKALAEMVSMSEQRVLEKVSHWRETGIIRRLGAVFDSARLGYVSTLLAARVPGDRVDEIASIINEYPGVTHNYLRDVPEGDYNVWFTLTSPGEDELEKTVSEIAERTGVDVINLPKTRMFKINVRFRLDEERGSSSEGRGETGGDEIPARPIRLDDLDKKIVMELQDDIPLTARPFASIGRLVGADESIVLDRIRALLDSGVIRRFGATLKHVAVGYDSNVMAVWKVPDQDLKRAGEIMAGFEGVSHCYARKTYPDWPYNLYTMIHARDPEESSAIVEKISRETGIGDYRLLYTLRELKKRKMRYERL